jgi:hypothetical protein
MLQRRLRIVKWLGTAPAVGVCTLCSQELKAPMSALRRTADAQASLQGQFEGHKCEPEDSGRAAALATPDALLRHEPDEEDDEEDDDRKKEDDEDDDKTDDGYSE